MEVVETSTEMLCNRQVLDFLKNYTSKKQTNLATILYETSSYLESSPIASSSLTNVSEFLDIVRERKYDLTKMEKIQIINLKPENDVELQLIIDNIDDKMNEQQRIDLLALIQSTLFKPSTESDGKQKEKKLKT